MEFQWDAATIEQVKGWAVQAGKIALEHQPVVTELIKPDQIKADQTPVSAADYRVERYLVDQIRRAYPRHAVLAEETGWDGPRSDWVWALDPIDGTKSFLHNLPVWAVSIGLLHQGCPVAGVIYLPVSRGLYWGGPGGAWWNGCPLPAHARLNYDDSLLSLAVHSHAHEDNHIAYPRIQAMGSTAAHLAFLAAGRAVGVLARRIHLWDLAAGLAILAQTGAQAEYLSGAQLKLEALMDGRKTPEQVLVTYPEWMAQLRSQIIPR